MSNHFKNAALSMSILWAAVTPNMAQAQLPNNNLKTPLSQFSMKGLESKRRVGELIENSKDPSAAQIKLMVEEVNKLSPNGYNIYKSLKIDPQTAPKSLRGGVDTGGGVGYSCEKDGPAFMVDSYLAAQKSRKLALGPSTLNYKQKVLHAISHMMDVAPNRGVLYLNFFKEMMADNEIDWTDSEIANEGDYKGIQTPNGCTQLLVIAYQNDEAGIYLGNKRYTINREKFFKRLKSEDERATLILHELVYRDIIKSSMASGKMAREVAVTLFSENFNIADYNLLQSTVLFDQVEFEDQFLNNGKLGDQLVNLKDGMKFSREGIYHIVAAVDCPNEPNLGECGGSAFRSLVRNGAHQDFFDIEDGHAKRLSYSWRGDQLQGSTLKFCVTGEAKLNHGSILAKNTCISEPDVTETKPSFHYSGYDSESAFRDSEISVELNGGYGHFINIDLDPKSYKASSLWIRGNLIVNNHHFCGEGQLSRKAHNGKLCYDAAYYQPVEGDDPECKNLKLPKVGDCL